MARASEIIIFLDECGYTGQDLLNLDQPIFTLASHDFSENESKSLKAQYFSKVKARELKFSLLSKRPRQQRMVIDFLTGISNSPNKIKFSINHKRFAIVTKLVDILIEPALHEDGIDLYDKGGNIALANLLYYGLRSVVGETFFNNLLFRFQELVRQPTPETYGEFYQPLLQITYPKIVEDFLIYLIYPHYRLGRRNLASIVNNSMDIALTCTFSLIQLWRARKDEQFVLIHDASSNMAAQKDIWEIIVDPELPNKIVGYDRRKWIFPFGVKRTLLETSLNWAVLQLADILAGSFTKCTRWIMEGCNSNDDFSKDLSDLLFNNYETHSIWPTQDVTPEELGTTGINNENLVDYVENLISKKGS